MTEKETPKEELIRLGKEYVEDMSDNEVVGAGAFGTIRARRLARLAIPVRNRRKMVVSMDGLKGEIVRLSEVIEKGSKAANWLGWVGVALTIILALAAVAQVAVMCWLAKQG